VPLFTSAPEGVEAVLLPFQLRGVAAVELDPLRGVVRELLPEIGARRGFLELLVDPRPLPADAAWPEPFNENPAPIQGLGRLVYSLDLEHLDRFGVGNGFKLSSRR
jgi:hypothetical protein